MDNIQDGYHGAAGGRVLSESATTHTMNRAIINVVSGSCRTGPDYFLLSKVVDWRLPWLKHKSECGLRPTLVCASS